MKQIEFLMTDGTVSNVNVRAEKSGEDTEKVVAIDVDFAVRLKASDLLPQLSTDVDGGDPGWHSLLFDADDLPRALCIKPVGFVYEFEHQIVEFAYTGTDGNRTAKKFPDCTVKKITINPEHPAMLLTKMQAQLHPQDCETSGWLAAMCAKDKVRIKLTRGAQIDGFEPADQEQQDAAE